MDSRTVTVEGIPMRWEETGEGLPLVLVHGIPTCPALWRHVVPQISGARCLAWEMVGYGGSIPEGRSRDISVARQADYLLAWMKTIGIERAVFARHDLGGGVAQIAAVREPARCAGLFLTNAIGYDSWPIPSVKAMRALGPVVRHLPNAAFKGVFGTFLKRGHDDPARASESVDVHWPNYARHDGAAAFIRQVRALDVQDTLRVADRLRDLKIPPRIVWGASDAFQKVRYGREVRQRSRRAAGSDRAGQAFHARGSPRDGGRRNQPPAGGCAPGKQQRRCNVARPSPPDRISRTALEGVTPNATMIAKGASDATHDRLRRQRDPARPEGAGSSLRTDLRRGRDTQGMVQAGAAVRPADDRSRRLFGFRCRRSDGARDDGRSPRCAPDRGRPEGRARHHARAAAPSGGAGQPAPAARRGAATVRPHQLDPSGRRGAARACRPTSHFERILSADWVRRLKPHAEVYHMAARECGVEPHALRLVAAHSWDVAGAMRAGCAAAFVARPGMVLDPLFEPPDIVGKDLATVAERILAVDV